MKVALLLSVRNDEVTIKIQGVSFFAKKKSEIFIHQFFQKYIY